SHPKVAEAAVVGAADETTGQAIVGLDGHRRAGRALPFAVPWGAATAAAQRSPSPARRRNRSIIAHL
ncbi:hypothetical protein ABT360_11350, partial [Streptomyces sp. NPDC000229]|uniref:AMP-binding enzyme n=1 Tax=Streptomyces sp. NPDC000229 TaxID=3154247 RepID=UPI0033225205